MLHIDESIVPRRLPPPARQGTQPSFSAALLANVDPLLPIRRSSEMARARQNICFAGEGIEDVLIILEGWAIKYHQLPNGKRQVLGILMAGDVVAGVAVFDDAAHYSVQTLTDVRFARVKRQDILARLGTDPTLFSAFTSLLVNERRELDEHLIDLGQRRADERIAALMLRLYRRLEMRGEATEQRFSCPLRQQHIADITGLTPVHVSRVLGSFRKRKLLEFGDGMVTILDMPELRKVSASR